MNLREQVTNALALLKKMGKQSEEIAATQRAIRARSPIGSNPSPTFARPLPPPNPPPVPAKRIVLTLIRGGLTK
jgi:hypothetical protein